MKHTSLAAAAFLTLLGGAAMAQQPAEPADNSAAVSPPMPMPHAGANATTSTVTTETAAGETTSTTTASTGVETQTSASGAAPAATMTMTVVASVPVPDTAENRAKYGMPMSNAGKRTPARGN